MLDKHSCRKYIETYLFVYFINMFFVVVFCWFFFFFFFLFLFFVVVCFFAEKMD